MKNTYKGVHNMTKHGLTINDFSDINERRRLTEEYGDMNACYRGENADGEDVELHIAKTGIIFKTYQVNGFLRVNTYAADGSAEGETFEGRWM